MHSVCLLVGDGQTDGRPSPDSVGPKLCRELPHGMGGLPIRAEKYSDKTCFREGGNRVLIKVMYGFLKNQVTTLNTTTFD